MNSRTVWFFCALALTTACHHAAPSRRPTTTATKSLAPAPPPHAQSPDPFWIAVSHDEGRTFQRTSARDALGREYLDSIAVTPAGVLYLLATGGVLRSTDGGTTFETLKRRLDLGNPDFNDIEVDASGTLYIATNRGLWISKDQAQTFHVITEAQGLPSSDVHGVHVGPGGHLYAATNDGVGISTDAGASFTNHPVGQAGSNENVVYQVYADEKRSVYALAWFGLSIARGHDARFASPSCCQRYGVRGVQVDSAGRVFVASDIGLFVSTDGGTTFGRRSMSGSPAPEAVADIYLAPSGTLFVATPNGIWISSDAGASFARKTAHDGLPADNVERILCDATGTVYAVHRIPPYSDKGD